MTIFPHGFSGFHITFFGSRDLNALISTFTRDFNSCYVISKIELSFFTLEVRLDFSFSDNGF